MRTSCHATTSPPLSRVWFVGALCVWAAGTLWTEGQPSPLPRLDVWRPDGPVLALAVDQDVAYVGGSFDYFGPASGSAGVVRREDAMATGAFPVLEGTVWAIVEDGAGGWFVGGAFTERVTQQARLLRVRADGSLDSTWHPDLQGTVLALLRDGAALYVAGDFGRINGEARSGLARFDFPAGQLATWNPAPNNEVHALASDGSRLYLGGSFTSIARQNRGRIAAVDLATGVLTAFNPGASGSGAIVRTLALSGTTLYVGGDFATCGGKPRARIAALNTLADTSNALDWNPGAGDDVYCLQIAGSRVYAAGGFTSIGGASRARIAALDPGSNSAVPGWDPGANGIVYALAVDGDGLLVGGAFTTLDDQARPGIGRLDRETGALSEWAPHLSALSQSSSPVVRAVAVVGEVVGVGGTLASSGGVPRSRLAAIDLVTGQPTAWNPGASGDVLALALSDTAVFVGGRFTNIAGAARTRLASIDRTTGAAHPFTANVTASGNNGVTALHYGASRLYLGGTFTAVNGQARANLAQVNATDGSLNTNWNPAPNGAVLCLTQDAAQLYVGGSFSSLGGSNRTALGAVSTAGTGRATSWQPRASDDVRAMHLVDRWLYVGGDFDTIGGAPRRRCAVLDVSTAEALVTWNPEVAAGSGTYQVQTLAVSGKVAYAGGTFSSAGGEFRTRLAGLHRADATATFWNPGANAVVRRLAYGTHHLVAGGDFTQMGDLAVAYLAVFSTHPFIPAGGLRLGADRTAEITVWEGDLPYESVEVQVTEALEAANWTPLGSQVANGRPKTWFDPNATGSAARFYRAVAW